MDNYKEILEKMKALKNDEDFENAHYDADNLLIEFLEDLGCNELVEAWHEVGKWYA